LSVAARSIVAPPLSVSLDGTRLVLRGPLTGRLGLQPHLTGLLSRCLQLPELQRLHFDLPGARIDLCFTTRDAAHLAARQGLAHRGPHLGSRCSKAFLGHLARRVWEAPVTLHRSGALLSTWRVRHVGGGRLRLCHPLLRGRPTAALVATRLQGPGVAVVRGSWNRDGAIDLQCDAAGPVLVLDLLARVEAIEAALAVTRPVAAPGPVGNALLLNVNLLLAAGAVVAPVLVVPSTLALAGAAVPVFRHAWKRLREKRADMTTVLAGPTILALVGGDRLPAALMLWMFRFWDVLTRRALRRAEIALRERLSLLVPPDPATVRSAAVAAARLFASVTRDREAQAFADSSAPLMLCVGTAALVSGGPSLAQAAMRPDFFSSVMVHRRLAAADVALRLARQGCVVRSFRTLLLMRNADQVVLDDSVDWEADADFGAAVAGLRLRETVYFHSPSNPPSPALISALGRPRLIVRSVVQTPGAYLSHQRFLGHTIIHACAVGRGDPLSTADVPIAVGENCLVEDRGAPIGLTRPSLGRMLTVIRTVKDAAAAERSVRLATNALNTALIAGAVYAGFSTLGIVVGGSVATGGLCAGMRWRVREAAQPGLTRR
jgi:hypothetical protein